MNIASKPTSERLSLTPRTLPSTVLPPATLSATWAGRTVVLVAAVTVVRWIIATTTGLSDTEAYYAGWARFPALSYYDHPPLVAWTTGVVTHLLRGPWAARVVPVLCAAAFDALLYRLATRLFSARAGFLAVALVSAIPVFFFTGFLVNPEGVLAPLWALMLLSLLDLRDHDEWWRPLRLGAVIGVAFLAKYTALLAVPVALLVVAGSAGTRRWLRRPSFYLAGLVALVLASPVIAWNAMHHWPSLQLHLSERMGHSPETLAAALRRVGGAQLLIFQPIVLPSILAVLGYAVARSRADERYRFLLTTSLPVLVFLLAVMVRAGDSEPHWTMVGYVPLIVAAAGYLDEGGGGRGEYDGHTGSLTTFPGRRPRVAWGVFRAALVLSTAVGVLYVVHVRSPALAKALPSYDPAADPFNETLGWDAVTAAARSHATSLGPGAVVAGAHNVLCGHLQLALDDSPPVYCPSSRRTEFDFTGRRTPPEGASVVFVDSDRYPEDTTRVLPRYVCRRVEDVAVDRSGLRVGRYRIHECTPRPEESP